MENQILDKITKDLNNTNTVTQNLLDAYNRMLKEKEMHPSKVDEANNARIL